MTIATLAKTTKQVPLLFEGLTWREFTAVDREELIKSRKLQYFGQFFYGPMTYPRLTLSHCG